MTSTTDVTAMSSAIAKETQALRDIQGLRLNIASISDIHLNHPNTPTEMIIRNLETYAFPDTPETHKLNIIFIGGDVTDSLMDFASGNAIAYRRWVCSFLWMCAKNDIMVRIIEGTPLHDWKQSNIFIEENENNHIGCDVKYFKDIHIETIDRYGIDVLYIPDEIRPTTQATWQRVQELLDERGLTQVDYAVMHGAFSYQLPDVASLKDKVHDEENYLSIVRHYIFIGHVHQHRPKGKIIPNGSFDRLAHGEEDIKGHVRLMKGNIEFVPNLGAMRYITLDVAGLPPEEILAKVDERLTGNLDKFKVRLRANRNDAAFGIIRRLSEIYPHGIFDVETKDKTRHREERISAREFARNGTMAVLTRENLLSELMRSIDESLRADGEFDQAQYDACAKLAENIIRAVK